MNFTDVGGQRKRKTNKIKVLLLCHLTVTSMATYSDVSVLAITFPISPYF